MILITLLILPTFSSLNFDFLLIYDKEKLTNVLDLVSEEMLVITDRFILLWSLFALANV